MVRAPKAPRLDGPALGETPASRSHTVARGLVRAIGRDDVKRPARDDDAPMARTRPRRPRQAGGSTVVSSNRRRLW